MIVISRILIDATSLCRKTTGIEYYTLQIVKNLLENDTENEYIILFRNVIREELLEYKEKATFIVCNVDSQIFCEQIWIPYIIKKLKPEVIHFPAFPPGFFVKHKKLIFTLHDATMWKYKDTISLKNKLYMRPLSELAIRKAKYIFTVSENSKENIIDVFYKYKHKIKVTSESISEKFKIVDKSNVIDDIKTKFNTGDNYLLSVCSLEPRKNIPTLLKAYAELIKNEKYRKHKLVLVGRKAWGNNVIEDTIKSLDLNNQIIITDYVTDEELIKIYNCALCFIYPSLYEGFGLPVLEAMACGLPVITSNNSSLPEVAGDAALFVDEKDPMNLCSNIIRMIDDKELRQTLILKGKQQMKKFSWGNIIQLMIGYYMEE